MQFLKTLARQFMNQAAAGDAGPAAGGQATGTAAPAPEAVPAPQPAPQPTPAPAPAPAPKEAADPAPAPAPVEFKETGRPGVDAFGKFLAANGIGMDHPAFVALDNGDFSLLRAELSAKGVPGTDAMIALAETEFKAMEQEAEQRAQAEEQMLLHVFGGDQGVADAVLDWARANAEPHEKEAVNAAFEAGGVQAQMAAVWLREMHRAAGNTVPAESPLLPNAGAGKPSAGGTISVAEYQQAIADGVRMYGPMWANSDQALALERRIR